MKTLLSSSPTTNSYSDSEHENYIVELKNYLLAHFGMLGQQHASPDNKPDSMHEFTTLGVNPIENKIQGALDYNQQKYLPISGMAIAIQIDKKGKEKTARLRNDIHQIEQDVLELEAEKEKLAKPDTKKNTLHKWVLAGIIILSIGEGAFFFEALKQKLPIYSALILGVMLAVIIGLGCHIGGKYIKNSPNLKIKILRSLAFLIPGFVLCYVVGHTRADAYNEKDINLHTDNVNSIASPQQTMVDGWSLTLFSFLLFSTILFLSVYAAKTKDEEKQDLLRDELDTKIREKGEEIAAKQKQIEEIEKDTIEKKNGALSRFEYAKAFERRLIALAKEALNTYIHFNIRHRTDGVIPEFFSYKPAFDFRLFFENPKLN